MARRRARRNTAPKFEVRLDAIASQYQLYPGETFDCQMRVEIGNVRNGLSIALRVPDDIRPVTTDAIDENATLPSPSLIPVYGGYIMTWDFNQKFAVGELVEIPVEFVVEQLNHDVIAEIMVEAFALGQITEEALISRKTLEVQVRAKGKYLKYLPMIYEEDEFMGRYLMIFERMLQPIESRINNIWDYFDPKLMPPNILAYMANVLDLDFDPNWPEERRRRMVAMGIQMHRLRGTKRGLQQILEIYTGGQVQIIERTAQSMKIGAGSQLGIGMALGHDNQPNTFQVNMWVDAPEDLNKKEKETYKKQLVTEMKGVINAHIPAQATYNLELELT